MTLQSNLLLSTVRLVGALHPALGISERGVIGTGFNITVQSEAYANVRYGYLVTAAHVLRDQRCVEMQAPDPFTGLLHNPMPIPKTAWRIPLPKVDLACASLEEIEHPKPLVARTEQWIVPNRTVHRVYLGQTIHYIGILTPLDRVMARSGTIGAVNQEGLEHEHGYEYPAHLVDCRSYWGFSGSPCYLEVEVPSLLAESPPHPLKGNLGPTGRMIAFTFLAGMFTQHLSEKFQGGATSLYGVGVMLRGQEIREALMSEELQADRRTRDHALPTS